MELQRLNLLNQSQRELLAIIANADLVTEEMLGITEFSETVAADLATIAETGLISISKEIQGFNLTVPQELKSQLHLEYLQLPLERRLVTGKIISQSFFDRDKFIEGLKVLSDCGDKRLFTDAMLSKTIEVRSDLAAEIISDLASKMLQDTFIDKLASASYKIVGLIWKCNYVAALNAIDSFESKNKEDLVSTKLISTMQILRAVTHFHMGCASTGTSEILQLVDDIENGNHALAPSAVIMACKTLATTALMVQDPRWSHLALSVAAKHMKEADSEYIKFMYLTIEAVHYFIEGNLHKAYEKAITTIYISNTSGFAGHQSPLEALYIAATCEEEFMQNEKALENWKKIIEIAKITSLPGWLAVGRVREARAISNMRSNHDVMSVIQEMRAMASKLPYKNEVDTIIDIDEIFIAYRQHNFDRLKVLAERIKPYPRVRDVLEAVNVHKGGRKSPSLFQNGTPREEIMDLLVRANMPGLSDNQLKKLIERILNISEQYGFRRIILVQRPHILAMVMKISAAGKSAYYEHLVRNVRSITESKASGSPIERIALTNKEKEVLDLLVAGFDRKQICDNLAITLNTLKTHQKKLYEKLGVNNREKAVDAAQKLGLIAG